MINISFVWVICVFLVGLILGMLIGLYKMKKLVKILKAQEQKIK